MFALGNPVKVNGWGLVNVTMTVTEMHQRGEDRGYTIAFPNGNAAPGIYDERLLRHA